jgi:hypothetical protein
MNNINWSKIRKKLDDIAISDLHFRGIIYYDDVLKYILSNENKLYKDENKSYKGFTRLK